MTSIKYVYMTQREQRVEFLSIFLLTGDFSINIFESQFFISKAIFCENIWFSITHHCEIGVSF